MMWDAQGALEAGVRDSGELKFVINLRCVGAGSKYRSCIRGWCVRGWQPDGAGGGGGGAGGGYGHFVNR